VSSNALGDDGSAYVSWLERKDDRSARVVAGYITAAGSMGCAIEVASGGGMALGYPRLSRSAAGTLIAWGNDKVQIARLTK
jgi:hypothetical protein